MSPLDKKSIRERLLKLQDIISDLRQYGKEAKSLAAFCADRKLNGAAMFSLVIGIEIITDIGNHILSVAFQKSAKDSEDILRLLGEVGIVPKKVIRDNGGMAGFRNVVIHEYAVVDFKKVYRYLKKAPEVFCQFAYYYNKFLEKH